MSFGVIGQKKVDELGDLMWSPSRAKTKGGNTNKRTVLEFTKHHGGWITGHQEEGSIRVRMAKGITHLLFRYSQGKKKLRQTEGERYDFFYIQRGGGQEKAASAGRDSHQDFHKNAWVA